MRRVLLLVLVVAGLIAAALGPVLTPSSEGPSFRPVSSALLVCPELTGAGAASSALSAVVAGPVQPVGGAALRPMTATTDLVRLLAPGDPVALVSPSGSQGPVLLQADGSWAPTALAGISTRQRTDLNQGLSSAPCVPPGPSWWFVGAGSQLGRGAALLVANPADEPARFDISLFAAAGPVQALAGKGIDLGPRSNVRLRLDALAPDQDLLAIRVSTTSGRVAAAVRDVAVPSDQRARGVDFIPAAQPPADRLVIAGIPVGSGERFLVLVNPGDQFATVTPALLTETGPEPIDGLATIAVPAGSVIQVDLARVLDGRAASLDLRSDAPITGGARAAWGGATRDVTWLSAVPTLGGPEPLGGAAAVLAGPGLTTTVTIAAPDQAVRGELTVTTSTSAQTAALTDPQAAAPAGSGPLQVALLDPPDVRTQTVSVPAGAQRTLTVSQDASAQEGGEGLISVTWRAAPESGPAAISHLTLDEAIPLATGYPWWPVLSTVAAVGVREDLGILAPPD
ncbi:MAG: DUF5719 family protein [Candidatus Nanopelagicales bacterium]